jgi:hypothetical protein
VSLALDTAKRRKLLDKPPPEGFARWTGPLLAGALGNVDVQYVWRFLRSQIFETVRDADVVSLRSVRSQRRR